jgi:hypothetical protein
VPWPVDAEPPAFVDIAMSRLESFVTMSEVLHWTMLVKSRQLLSVIDDDGDDSDIVVMMMLLLRMLMS